MLSLRRMFRVGAATVCLVATVSVLAATPAASAGRTTWSIVSAPGTGLLSGVTCISNSDCWAVGGTGGASQSIAQHWDGTAWSLVPTPDTSPSQINDLTGVACTDSSDCWAVGYAADGGGGIDQALAEHWDGAAWSIVTTPDVTSSGGDVLSGVACVSTSDCWAVGSYTPPGFPVEDTQALVEQWDGTAWSIVTTPVPNPLDSMGLFGVACVATSDCWAVGFAYVGGGGSKDTLAEHWDGSAWSIVATGDPSFAANQLSGVTCLDTSDCWAVGFTLDANGDRTSQTFADHWDGSAWSNVATPNTSSTRVNQLDGVSCDSSSDCWAVGSGEAVAGIEQTLAEHWDGASWVIVKTPDTDRSQQNVLEGVSCTAPSDCWAVGAGGGQTLIEHSSVRTRITRPGAPTGVMATPGVGSISVSWTAPDSDGGSPIVYYVSSANYNGRPVCTTPGPTATGPTACTVTGLTGGRDYTLRVRAVNAVGAGPPGTVTVFLPRS